MSKTAQATVGVIVAIIVVAGIAWWWSASRSGAPSSAPSAPSAPATVAPSAPSQPSAANTPAPGTTLASGNSNSNTALNSDLSQIDGQMSAMSGDSASINQGMNDQPVQQSQL